MSAVGMDHSSLTALHLFGQADHSTVRVIDAIHKFTHLAAMKTYMGSKLRNDWDQHMQQYTAHASEFYSYAPFSPAAVLVVCWAWESQRMGSVSFPCPFL